MRRRAATVLALAGLCSMLAAGCETAVNGRGTLAEGASPSSTSSPSRPGTSGAGTAGSSAPSGRQSLRCPDDKVLAPSGAPYCYTLPAGFTDVSSSVTVDTRIGSEKYRTAVAVAERDIIIVSVYQLRLNTDAISSRVLERELAGVLGRLSGQGFIFDSNRPRMSWVDGARAFGYHAAELKDRLQADVYFIFRTHTEVEVNCQWQDRPAEVRRGCQQLLSSMQITSGT
jgi:hypothetical protein